MTTILKDQFLYVLCCAAMLLLFTGSAMAQSLQTTESLASPSSLLNNSLINLEFMPKQPMLMVAAEASSAMTPDDHIAVLQNFYEKRLVGLAEVQQIFPKKWLIPDAILDSEKQTYEERLQKALFVASERSLTREPGSKDEHSLAKDISNTQKAEREIELLQLTLQWLNFSASQRLQLIAEAESKWIVAQNERLAKENLAAAQTTSFRQSENTKKIEHALKESGGERERKLLSILFDLEKYLAQIGDERHRLGSIQQSFTHKVKNWQSLSTDISEAIEDEGFYPGTQNFTRSRTTLRELLRESNSVVKNQPSFERFYNLTASEYLSLDNIPTVQVRDTDTEFMRNSIQEIQQKRIAFQVALASYQRDRAQLSLDIMNWQMLYRKGLVDLRSQLISEVIDNYAFVLNTTEPVIVEFETVIFSIGFWWWKARYEDNHREIVARKQIRLNTFTHIFKLFLLSVVIVWVFARRKHILQTAKLWILRRVNNKKQARTATIFFGVLRDLYVFFILLFLGKVTIEFSASLGFESARLLSPILDTVIVFFLLLGLINYLSPLLSQRQVRGEKYSADVAALEAVFETIPKFYLYYWFANALVSFALIGFLGTNLIRYYLANIFGVITLLVLFIHVWRNRYTWRQVNDQANTSEFWHRFSGDSRDKIWEPLILLIGGGLGVYRLAWRILSERLSEMEMTRSFQAMLSRAILERQHRRYAVQINSTRFPDTYWNAFDFRIPAAPNWYVRRSEAEEMLSGALEEWETSGCGARILICGDRGIGKSELIAEFVRETQFNYQHCRISTGDTSIPEVCRRINIDLFKDDSDIEADRLIERINQWPPTIIAMENLENAMLRKVGGFDTFSFLLDLLLRCSKKHLWVTTVTNYAWAITKQGVVGANCFSSFIALGGVSEEELKTLILTRHNELNSSMPDFSHLNLRPKNVKKMEPEEIIIEKTRNLYFRILWDYTRGNPRQALYYWKASLVWKEGQTEVTLFDVPEQRVLENLPDVTLMILAALIEHNGLTLRGLTQIMNVPMNVILRRLEELAPHGIVFSFDDGERAGWHVESFWSRGVENYLIKRQFLFSGVEL